MVWRSQRGEDAGEELQTHLDLCAVTVPAGTQLRLTPPEREKPPHEAEDAPAHLQSKLVPLVTHFLDVVLQVVKEELHHVQLLLRPPDSMDTHTHISTEAHNQSVTMTTLPRLHGDPVSVVAGAKLLESAEEFWQQT